MKHLPMILALALSIGTSVSGQADGELALCNEVQWKQATATAEQVAVGQHGLTLQPAPQGHAVEHWGTLAKDGRSRNASHGCLQGRWTSKWLDAPDGDSWKSVAVEAEINLFANKTIEVIVDGSAKPFVDADGVEHDWYGRCMIAILDARR